jgi:hypothetical protein
MRRAPFNKGLNDSEIKPEGKAVIAAITAQRAPIESACAAGAAGYTGGNWLAGSAAQWS